MTKAGAGIAEICGVVKVAAISNCQICSFIVFERKWRS